MVWDWLPRRVVTGGPGAAVGGARHAWPSQLEGERIAGRNAEVRGCLMEHESQDPGTAGLRVPSGGLRGPRSSRLILPRRFSLFVPCPPDECLFNRGRVDVAYPARGGSNPGDPRRRIHYHRTFVIAAGSLDF